MPVACFRHPPGAGEMAVMDEFRVLRIMFWIDAKNDQNHFLPVSAFIVGVQKPDVGGEVAFVIRIDAAALRRTILEGWYGHSISPDMYQMILASLRRCSSYASRDPKTALNYAIPRRWLAL